MTILWRVAIGLGLADRVLSRQAASEALRNLALSSSDFATPAQVAEWAHTRPEAMIRLLGRVLRLPDTALPVDVMNAMVRWESHCPVSKLRFRLVR